METKPLDSQTAVDPYKSPTPDEITIVATGISDGSKEADTKIIPIEVFNELSDCHFNAAHLYGSISKTEKKTVMATSLANAAEAKINIIATNFYFNINDGYETTGLDKAKAYFDFFNKPKTFVGDNGIMSNNSDAIKGWALKDEPTFTQISQPGNKVSYNLKNVYDYIRENDSQDRIVHVNLPGGVCDVLENHSFEEYLNVFQANFNPRLWSYDFYPVYQKSCLLNDACKVNGDCAVDVDHETFYADLDTFHKRAKATGGVFWAYVQSAEYIHGNIFRPAALEPYIRFEAFSALAFGAQGIVYWTYRPQPNTESSVRPSALVDRHADRMAAWYFARQVNYEIKEYSKVFVNSELKAWGHAGNNYGGPSIGEGGIGGILSIKASGAGALVTQLKTNGHNYVVIVSHDVVNFQTVEITFVPTVIYELTPTNSHGTHGTEKQIKTRTIKRQLIPGGYLIYEFTGSVS